MSSSSAAPSSTAAAVTCAAEISRALPRGDVRKIADALLTTHGLSKLQAVAPQQVRLACLALKQLDLDEVTRPVAAGVLLAALESEQRTKVAVTPVWTGPATLSTARLTSAVVVDLIGQAVEHVLLVGYAVHSEKTVESALHAARARGVTVTLVLERHADNASFNNLTEPFPGLDATQLRWPAGVRPVGASLHAKLLVIDEASALVGSANITNAAFTKNLECGLLVRGGETARDLRRHIASLLTAGSLLRVK